MRQQAVRAESISLLCDTEDPGWMFAELSAARADTSQQGLQSRLPQVWAQSQ